MYAKLTYILAILSVDAFTGVFLISQKCKMKILLDISPR